MNTEQNTTAWCSLTEALVKRGYYVVCIDLCDLDYCAHGENILKGWEYHKADVRDAEGLKKLFAGCVAVLHVASYGMSGASQLMIEKVRAINVDGTKAVLNACIETKVRALVFTSTYNVVFGGQKIAGLDETEPYFPLHKHIDEYSRTKTEAEMAVLEANMMPLDTYTSMSSTHASSATDLNAHARSNEIKNRSYLKTCAIRPAAIWGRGESRHMLRVARYLKRGIFCFRFGDPNAHMDFVHVNNLVQAHLLAMEDLLNESSIAAGNAYFISDGEDQRINNFDFFSQLAIGLHYPKPRLSIPLPIMYVCATIFEYLYWLVGISPLLTRAEILKAGICHWFSIEKARRELGYKPDIYHFDEVLEQFKEFEKKNSSKSSQNRVHVFFFIFFAPLLIAMFWATWQRSHN